jgi:hypothetical protein
MLRIGARNSLKSAGENLALLRAWPGWATECGHPHPIRLLIVDLASLQREVVVSWLCTTRTGRRT